MPLYFGWDCKHRTVSGFCTHVKHTELPEAACTESLCPLPIRKKHSTIQELRKQFEEAGKGEDFTRDEDGYYIDKTVHYYWMGFRTCAKLNNIMPEEWDPVLND